MKHHKAETLGEQCAGEEKKAVEKHEEYFEDDATKAIMSTPCKGSDLNLDPGNPPKYCPQCACTGVKSKVKKLKIDPASQKLVIMCKNEKCPWPFSVKSPAEVTVTDGSSDVRAVDGVIQRREDAVGLQLSKAATKPSPSPNTKYLSAEQRNQIIHDCVEDQISPTVLAKKWQCNADTIRTWVRKAGKKLPKQYKKSTYPPDPQNRERIATPETSKLPPSPESFNRMPELPTSPFPPGQVGVAVGDPPNIDSPPSSQGDSVSISKKKQDEEDQIMDGKLYCILCQEAHKMTASCLQDVQCKLCSRKGHLRKDCPENDSHFSLKKGHQSEEDCHSLNSGEYFKTRKRKASDSPEDISNALLKSKMIRKNTEYESSEKQLDNTENSRVAQTRIVSSEDDCQIEEDVVIISDDDKDILNDGDTQESKGMTEEPAEHPSKSDKIMEKSKQKKSPILKAGNYHIVSTQIELFRSNKSSSTKLTQLSCTVYGSFFRGIKPQGLERYLDNYKLGGDLLKALHMTREDDGTFLYRSQFEIIEDDKKIICVEEKKALEDFLEFLHKFPRCVLLGVDEDSVSILVKKLKEVNQKKVKELIVGFTYWKRVLRYLNTDRNLDLEEYFSQTLGKDLSSHTIPEVLLTSVMDVGYKMEKHFSRNSFYKLCKRIDCLKKPTNVEFDRKAEIESVEVFSSFRPSVSATFTAEKLVQVTLSSESDSEPEETGQSVSNKCEVPTRSSMSDPEEVPIVLPDVRNDGCGCKIRKKDFKTLSLPEFLVKSSEHNQKEPTLTELQKLPTRKNAWQKGKGKRFVCCPLCYCKAIKYDEIANHIVKVHKAQVTCLLCYSCKTPVSPSGLAAHMTLCDMKRKTKSGPVCQHCQTRVARSGLAAHRSRCGALFIKLGQSSKRTPVPYKPLTTDPSSSTQSEPRSSSQSQPSKSSQSQPSSSSQSQPSKSSQSQPRSSTQSQPSKSFQSEPRCSSQSQPCNSSRSQPSSSSQTQPCNSSRSQPRSSVQPQPRSSSQSELRSFSKSEPMSLTQSEPMSSSQNEPKSSSQSRIDLPSGPNKNLQSCLILNSTAVDQSESRTSQKAKQSREGNFRARGFGPFVARGNRPMFEKSWGNGRGFGDHPFVRGNMRMSGGSGPLMRGREAMGPRGGMMGGPCVGPSPWNLGGGGGMEPPGWGPQGNQGGGMGNMGCGTGGIGPQGWGPWNQGGGMGNMEGGRGGIGPQGWGPWNQGGGMGNMEGGRGGIGPQGWGPWNIGGGMGNMRGGFENNMGRGMGGNTHSSGGGMQH